MIVLDAFVALKWVLPEADTPKAVKLRKEYRQGFYDLLSPDFFPLEVASALSKAQRKGIIQGRPLIIFRRPKTLNQSPFFPSIANASTRDDKQSPCCPPPSPDF